MSDFNATTLRLYRRPTRQPAECATGLPPQGKGWTDTAGDEAVGHNPERDIVTGRSTADHTRGRWQAPRLGIGTIQLLSRVLCGPTAFSPTVWSQIVIFAVDSVKNAILAYRLLVCMQVPGNESFRFAYLVGAAQMLVPLFVDCVLLSDPMRMLPVRGKLVVLSDFIMMLMTSLLAWSPPGLWGGARAIASELSVRPTVLSWYMVMRILLMRLPYPWNLLDASMVATAALIVPYVTEPSWFFGSGKNRALPGWLVLLLAIASSVAAVTCLDKHNCVPHAGITPHSLETAVPALSAAWGVGLSLRRRLTFRRSALSTGASHALALPQGTSTTGAPVRGVVAAPAGARPQSRSPCRLTGPSAMPAEELSESSDVGPPCSLLPSLPLAPGGMHLSGSLSGRNQASLSRCLDDPLNNTFAATSSSSEDECALDKLLDWLHESAPKEAHQPYKAYASPSHHLMLSAKFVPAAGAEYNLSQLQAAVQAGTLSALAEQGRSAIAVTPVWFRGCWRVVQYVAVPAQRGEDGGSSGAAAEESLSFARDVRRLLPPGVLLPEAGVVAARGVQVVPRPVAVLMPGVCGSIDEGPQGEGVAPWLLSSMALNLPQQVVDAIGSSSSGGGGEQVVDAIGSSSSGGGGEQVVDAVSSAGDGGVDEPGWRLRVVVSVPGSVCPLLDQCWCAAQLAELPVAAEGCGRLLLLSAMATAPLQGAPTHTADRLPLLMVSVLRTQAGPQAALTQHAEDELLSSAAVLLLPDITACSEMAKLFEVQVQAAGGGMDTAYSRHFLPLAWDLAAALSPVVVAARVQALGLKAYALALGQLLWHLFSNKVWHCADLVVMRLRSAAAPGLVPLVMSAFSVVGANDSAMYASNNSMLPQPPARPLSPLRWFGPDALQPAATEKATAGLVPGESSGVHNHHASGSRVHIKRSSSGHRSLRRASRQLPRSCRLACQVIVVQQRRSLAAADQFARSLLHNKGIDPGAA